MQQNVGGGLPEEHPPLDELLLDPPLDEPLLDELLPEEPPLDELLLEDPLLDDPPFDDPLPEELPPCQLPLEDPAPEELPDALPVGKPEEPPLEEVLVEASLWLGLEDASPSDAVMPPPHATASAPPASTISRSRRSQFAMALSQSTTRAIRFRGVCGLWMRAEVCHARVSLSRRPWAPDWTRLVAWQPR